MTELLKYKPGGRWAFMQTTVIPDDDDQTKVYLWRLRILLTPWFAIYLHRIFEPDRGRLLHNHPRTFIPIILWGGYHEDLAPTPQDAQAGWYRTHHRRRFSIRRITHEQYHSIPMLDRSPTWTLVFLGKSHPDGWGFMAPDGFIPWREYRGSDFIDEG